MAPPMYEADRLIGRYQSSSDEDESNVIMISDSHRLIWYAKEKFGIASQKKSGRPLHSHNALCENVTFRTWLWDTS